MAVAYVRDAGLKTSANFSGTTTGSFSTGPAVGNHVMVGIACWRDAGSSGAISAVTDNQGNTYAIDKQQSLAAADSTAAIASTKVATSSGTYTITVDPTDADALYIAWTAVEFSGVATSSHLDRTGNNSSTSGDASVTASAANTTTAGVAVGVAAVSNNDADINIGDAPPSGYTNIQINENASGFIGFSMVRKIYASSETSSASWTHDNTAEDGWEAVICTYKAAGGTQYNQSASGAIGSSAITGALSKQDRKSLSGAIATIAGGMSKRTSRSLSGAIASITGGLSKRTSRALAGSIATITGALATSKTFLRSLSGSIATITGTLARQTGKALSGGATPGGALSKQIRRSLSGGIATITGALGTTRVILRSLAGEITTLTGSLSRRTNRSLSGAASLAGEMTRRTSKITAGAISTIGGTLSTVRVILRSLSGAISTIAGTLVRQTNRGLSGEATPSGSLSRQIATGLSGTLSAAGSAIKQIQRSLAGELTLAGSAIGAKLTALGISLGPAAQAVYRFTAVFARRVERRVYALFEPAAQREPTDRRTYATYRDKRIRGGD